MSRAVDVPQTCPMIDAAIEAICGVMQELHYAECDGPEDFCFRDAEWQLGGIISTIEELRTANEQLRGLAQKYGEDADQFEAELNAIDAEAA